MRLTWMSAEMPAHESLQVAAEANEQNWFCIGFFSDKHAEAPRRPATSFSALPYSYGS
jgi:hypothetical protein